MRLGLYACNGCNMGMRDLPDMHVWPKPERCRPEA